MHQVVEECSAPSVDKLWQQLFHLKERLQRRAIRWWVGNFVIFKATNYIQSLISSCRFLVENNQSVPQNFGKLVKKLWRKFQIVKILWNFFLGKIVEFVFSRFFGNSYQCGRRGGGSERGIFFYLIRHK